MAANVGAFVDGAVTAPSPGRKNDAGEIECEPLIPPQPMPAARINPVSASRHNFQFNFTLSVCDGIIMRATLNSPLIRRLAIALCVVLTAFATRAQTNFDAQFERAYTAAQTAYSTNSTNFDAALDLARAAFDWAELDKNKETRESIANIGMDAARTAIRLKSDSAPAHYYLALNIGQLARTKMLGALKLLTEMERELKRSIELDPKFDYAGATRTLGVLYMEAPGWPASIGNKTKARTLLEHALQLAPNYPDNHLTYLEALQKWKDTKTLAERLPIYETLLPKAKQEFSAPDWQDEWQDWDRRWQSIQAKRK
jgi:hypothetical protein